MFSTWILIAIFFARRKRIKQQDASKTCIDDSAITSDNNSLSNNILDHQAGGQTCDKSPSDTESHQKEDDSQEQFSNNLINYMESDKLYLDMLKYYRRKGRFLNMKQKLQNPVKTDY